jgi:hypothetical protein
MIQLGEALGLLSRARVEFIVGGGVAAIAHGSARRDTVARCWRSQWPSAC